ncbi:MAG: D-alanyl-D-alanine carboxypeptidase [Oscillospiraceae bacterium]|nr:D-alanyl-D-alanine carboxypeptidase [Oscillospiraceae bacterium]
MDNNRNKTAVPFRRFLAVGLVFLSLWQSTWNAAATGAEVAVAPEPKISAKYAVLMDADTGDILWAKEEHVPAPVASTTKILTALLLLEAGDPELTLTVTPDMVAAEGTSMGLKAGDLVSRYVLACGMLLSSGNDAANSAAIHLAGSLPAFAARMNARAAQIGIRDSHFVTPSGLDAEGHQATAYDMALLAREAIANPAFRDICSQQRIRVTYGNPQITKTLSNHNRLLREAEGVFGVKTGFTKKSGRCLVTAARREGITLIAVTLADPNDWDDHKILLDYGFSLYQATPLDVDLGTLRLPVTGGAVRSAALNCAWVPEAKLRPQSRIRREILLRHFEYAPLPADTVVGAVRYYAGDALLAEVPIVVQTTVPQKAPAKPRTTKKQQATT